ncbi:MAG TPA: Uma2 family endonuclease [Tepidisphaeraceae bacterium]|nr:Uma2 family endonuclease [Tepidisphaeraceae bacterium]
MITPSPVRATRPSPSTLPPLENGDHLDQPTFHARYEAMSEAFRAELIGGIVHMPSPLKVNHGDAHARLIFWLATYGMNTPGIRVLDNATDILGIDSEPQPDACLTLERGQTHINSDGYLVGPPELVAEVASSSQAHDLFEKRRDYEKYGVSEYLALLVREARAAWFVRPAGQPRPAGFVELPADPDGILRSPSIPGLWLDAPALLRGDSRRIVEVLEQGMASPERAAFVQCLGQSR